ncbi:UNKNOWN [Stylonychia lemnae]|uniref:Uncharacterized protein n=1 Tax=Stylonychia lemnae TaxID=5949 RepID=A0A078A964_STYLE|nr:UNKNOWN [Stylonychia lemnae]|eukprot:CDW78769.1 UNKNOWN [Stylonychia lemnae]
MSNVNNEFNNTTPIEDPYQQHSKSFVQSRHKLNQSVVNPQSQSLNRSNTELSQSEDQYSWEGVLRFLEQRSKHIASGPQQINPSAIVLKNHDQSEKSLLYVTYHCCNQNFNQDKLSKLEETAIPEQTLQQEATSFTKLQTPESPLLSLVNPSIKEIRVNNYLKFSKQILHYRCLIRMNNQNENQKGYIQVSNTSMIQITTLTMKQKMMRMKMNPII